MNVLRFSLVVLLCVLTVGCAWPGRLLRGYASGRPIGKVGAWEFRSIMRGTTMRW